MNKPLTARERADELAEFVQLYEVGAHNSKIDIVDFTNRLERHFTEHEAAIRAEYDWLPIETAPRDGRSVELWHAVHKCTVTCRYMEHGTPDEPTLVWYEKTMTHAWPEDAFTHYRLIKAPGGE